MRIRSLVAAMVAASMFGGPPVVAQGSVAQKTAKGRTLSIVVKSLPKGAKAPLKVTGPHKYHRTARVNGKWTLKRLAPGRYKVRAKSVTVQGDTWKPKVTPTSVRISNRRRKVTVTYSGPTPPVQPGFRPAVLPETVSAGRDHTCAIDTLGQPWCWGNGTFGQLGDGDMTGTDKWQPVAVTGSLTATTISAGGFHTCALVGNQVAWCWGDDNSGQLGDNNPTTFTSYQPRMVAGNHAFKAISAGGEHTCALDSAGKAWCWGSDDHGQVGDGNADQSDKYAPVAVAGDHTFATISAGWAATCAVDTAGHAWCWGEDQAGQLGDGDTGGTSKSEPVAVAGGHSFATISAGAGHTCALDVTGAAWCWGEDQFKQTGGSSLNVSPAIVHYEPVAVSGGHTFATISAGAYHNCAVDTSSHAWCWGENQDGRLGDGDTTGTDSLDPLAVSGGHTFAAISAGDRHTCAIDTSGHAWSWGWFYQGRLGLGEDVKDYQYAPAAVLGGHTYRQP